MSARYAHTFPFGAELIDSRRTRFRLWAPDAKSVKVEIPGLAQIAMHGAENGFFECDIYCGAHTGYRFRIDGSMAVPDPAARCQAVDVHDLSIVCDPRDYLWQCDDWQGRPWHEMVIYELHVGCCHGFIGVEQRLQELAELGITAIELMPINDFPGRRNWGYDGVLPFAPDVSYGTPDELKHLIDSAHRLGLCVYLDVVYNHFGPDGNFLPAYASSFFNPAKSSPWGAAIDFSQTWVRRFFTENALYWLLEYRFDGLRFDAAHQIDDAGWLDEMAAEVRARVEPGRHIHLMLENEHNRAEHLRGFSKENSAGAKQNVMAAKINLIEGRAGRSGLFDAQWNDDGHNVLHVLLTGEHDSYYRNYSENPAQKLARCLSEGFIYQGDDFSYQSENQTLQQRPRGTRSAHLPPTAFVLFLQNHDQIGNRAFGERLTTLLSNGGLSNESLSDESVGEEKLRAAITLLLLSPQIPLLFMGEEWGAATPFLFFTDFFDDLAAAVREGRRREFAALPAFADSHQRETIPDPNAVSTYTMSLLNQDEKNRQPHARYLQFYKQLLALRRTSITPHLPGCQSLGATAINDSAVFASWRLGNGEILHIITNFGDQALALNNLDTSLFFASELHFENDSTTHFPHGKKSNVESPRTLPAHSTHVFIELAKPNEEAA